MNPRIAKEFRSLLLPVSVAAGAGCAMVVLGLREVPSQRGEFMSFLFGLSTFVFFGSVALIAAVSFGNEYQQRTLPLLLSQPIHRARLWREKLLTGLFSIVAISLFLFFLSLILGHLWEIGIGSKFKNDSVPGEVVLVSATFLLTTVCSAGFWTLAARSTLGGMVFTFTWQLFTLLAILLVLNKIGVQDPLQTKVIALAGLPYSAIFLWLGWRKFSRLELRDVSFGESGASSRWLAGNGWEWAWFRCRPVGAGRNLIRKELRLYHPLFVIAAVLSFCWCVALGLYWLQPARREIYDNILFAVTAIYVPLLSVLAGCMSLGEEKALGLIPWHLTLPVSKRRQWLAKLGVAFGVWVALALVLPYLLACMASPIASLGLLQLLHSRDNGSEIFLISAGLMFVLSFWAITLVGNTVRAALASVIALAGLVAFAALGNWCALQSGNLPVFLLLVLVSPLHLPATWFSPPDFDRFCLEFGLALMVLTLLVQSLIQFRRAEGRTGALFKYSVILAGLAFGLTFLWTDFVKIRVNGF